MVATCTADVSYDTMSYYDWGIDRFVAEDKGVDPWPGLTVEFTPTPGTTYTAYGTYSVISYYYDYSYDPYTSWWCYYFYCGGGYEGGYSVFYNPFDYFWYLSGNRELQTRFIPAGAPSV